MPHERAGQPAGLDDLVDVSAVVAAYESRTPDPEDPAQQVVFGTSGHRGSSLDGSFNEAHILAITQAICEYRKHQGSDGPLLLGRDTHALSLPAWQTALQVLIGNDVTVLVDARDGFTPTPALSHAILRLNREGPHGRVDGIVVTPSHNPPRDGGFKYNPPHGGPADSDATAWIANRANALLRDGLSGVARVDSPRARAACGEYDFLFHYVDDLDSVIDMAAVRDARVRIGADPMGGASVAYWAAIAERWDLDLTVVNPDVDPRWAFMTLDSDGRIRMDCSSPYAMASLIGQRDAYDLAAGNDPDADRHGIVTPDGGLMNPNHVLAVAVDYLSGHRDWDLEVAIGKTLVSSAMIDRVSVGLNRRLLEMPVGFKWFVPGLVDGSLGFGGEESAGASFLRRDGTVWTTDKDGIIACLLTAELTARSGRDPGELYRDLTERFGAPVYRRVDAPATPAQKAILARLSPSDVSATDLAGAPVTAILTSAPGNGAPIGGVKVTTDDGWFAARPSGTENVYKIYAESFRGEDHLDRLIEEAQGVVGKALA